VPALLQAKSSQLSQPFLTAEVLQPSDYCCGLIRPRSNSSSSVLCWGLQSRTQDSWRVSPEQSRGAESPLFPYCPCCWGCSLGHCWPFGLWAHIAGSCRASRQPAPPSPCPQGCSRYTSGSLRWNIQNTKYGCFAHAEQLFSFTRTSRNMAIL